MRTGGRVGGWAVGPLVLSAFLTAYPPTRLSAQGGVGGGGVAEAPGSVRSAALAGAGAALVGDAGSIFANPAGVATIRHAAFEGSYQRLPQGRLLSSAAAAIRVGRLDYGVAGQALGDPSATISSADVLALSALVYRKGMIAVGASVKYARTTTSGVTTEGWAGDAGAALAVFDILAFGVSVQNLGGEDRLLRRTRVGFTMNYVDPQGSIRLLTTVEGQWVQGRSSVLVAGAEGGMLVGRQVGIMGRVGVTGHSVPTTAKAVTFGAGVELGRFHLDYAYQGFHSPISGAHRFGARWTP